MLDYGDVGNDDDREIWLDLETIKPIAPLARPYASIMFDQPVHAVIRGTNTDCGCLLPVKGKILLHRFKFSEY